MLYVELVFLVVGFCLLLLGYRRNDRNMMLAAAVLLLAVGTIGDFSQGLADSVRDWAR